MPYKKTIVFSILLSTVLILSAFMPQQEDKKPVNLKVLPKNISEKELDDIMDGFKAALGVKCNFCHTPRKDNPKKLDFASDENPKKEIARNMIRMVDYPS